MLIQPFNTHGSGPSGTVPHSVEIQLTYYAKLLRKVSTQGIKTVTPSQQAADDFVEYSDAFFPKTVLTDNCSSWANGAKQVNGFTACGLAARHMPLLFDESLDGRTGSIHM
jgi:hypothetical protein